jgi:hypothetical protein
LGPLIKIFCKNMSPIFYRMLSRTSRSESFSADCLDYSGLSDSMTGFKSSNLSLDCLPLTTISTNSRLTCETS